MISIEQGDWFSAWAEETLAAQPDIQEDQRSGDRVIRARLPVTVWRNQEGEPTEQEESRPMEIRYNPITGAISFEVLTLRQAQEFMASVELGEEGRQFFRGKTGKGLAEYFDSDDVGALGKAFSLWPYFATDWDNWMWQSGTDPRVIAGVDASGTLSLFGTETFQDASEKAERVPDLTIGWSGTLTDIDWMFRQIPSDSPIYPTDLQRANVDDRWAFFVNSFLSSVMNSIQRVYPALDEYCRWFYEQRRFDLVYRLKQAGVPNADRALLGHEVEATDWYRDTHGAEETAPPEERGREDEDWLAEWVWRQRPSGLANPVWDKNEDAMQRVSAQLPISVDYQDEAGHARREVVLTAFVIQWTTGHEGEKLLLCVDMTHPSGNADIRRQLRLHWEDLVNGWQAYTREYGIDTTNGVGFFQRIRTQQIAPGVTPFAVQNTNREISFGVMMELPDEYIAHSPTSRPRTELATEVVSALAHIMPDVLYYTNWFVREQLNLSNAAPL